MFESVGSALADLNEQAVLEEVRGGLATGAKPAEILAACQQGMVEVGRRFEAGEYYVSELIMAGDIFKQASALLEPLAAEKQGAPGGKVVVGTVSGDIHDIGKDIVVNMLRSANFEVIDLGVDVPVERFVGALRDSGATVLSMSGLMTTSFGPMKQTVDALQEAGLRDAVHIMIGGGPISEHVCQYVGADDFGIDAQRAVRLAKQWMEAE